MSSNNLIKAFHVLAVAHYSLASLYDFVYIVEPDNKRRGFSFGGRLTYFTSWNVVFQLIYFTLATLDDFSHLINLKVRRLSKIRHNFFCIIAFPYALFICIVFWQLFTYDRDLVLPKEFDSFFPPWLNHMVHTNILIFVMIEMIFVKRDYPEWNNVRRLINGMGIIYLVWLYLIKFVTGIWVYNVYGRLEGITRLMFHVYVIALPNLLFFIGKWMNGFIWKGIKGKVN